MTAPTLFSLPCALKFTYPNIYMFPILCSQYCYIGECHDKQDMKERILTCVMTFEVIYHSLHIEETMNLKGYGLFLYTNHVLSRMICKFPFFSVTPGTSAWFNSLKLSGPYLRFIGRMLDSRTLHADWNFCKQNKAYWSNSRRQWFDWNMTMTEVWR